MWQLCSLYASKNVQANHDKTGHMFDSLHNAYTSENFASLTPSTVQRFTSMS